MSQSSWNRCEGWFPDTWTKQKLCGMPSRTPGSKLCECCQKRKGRYKDKEAYNAKRREYYKKNPQKFRDYAYDDYWKHREYRLTSSALRYQRNAYKICAKKREKRANAKRLESKTDAERGLDSEPVSG